MGHAGKIGAVIEQINDDLEMQVRHPAAVFVYVADVGEWLAARDALSGLQCIKRLEGQVAIEREEFKAVARGVTKNNERPVIQGRSVDRDSMDDAVERRADWRARRGK